MLCFVAACHSRDACAYINTRRPRAARVCPAATVQRSNEQMPDCNQLTAQPSTDDRPPIPGQTHYTGAIKKNNASAPTMKPNKTDIPLPPWCSDSVHTTLLFPPTDTPKDGSYDDGKLIIVTDTTVLAIKLHRCSSEKITSCR